MKKFAACFTVTLTAASAALTVQDRRALNGSFESSPTGWTVVHGAAAPDNTVAHDGKISLRVRTPAFTETRVESPSLHLNIGKRYEVSGWIRTEKLEVRDTDRAPIAIGAALSMASLPFDYHSASVGGSRDWTRVSLRFVATRAEDRILCVAGLGGAAKGTAWFDKISIDEVGSETEWPNAPAVETFGAAYRYPNGGWIYLHIEGSPYERGYQHGFLLSKEIGQYLNRGALMLDPKSKERGWDSGRMTANALYLRGFDKELLEEMRGIADGAAARGLKWKDRPIDLVDVVTMNTLTEVQLLQSALPMTPTGLEGLNLRRPDYFDPKRDVPVTERCSAFAATGRATRDGHMVIGHITMWPLTLAEQTNIMLDIKPVSGHRVLMQSYPSGIQSGTDYYQNDAGMVLTETTIRQSPFNAQGTPVANRARKAIQYGTSVEEVADFLGKQNNGMYTNEWLIGDGKNDQIAMYELGTYRTKLYRSSQNEWFGGTEGFYWGCNNAKDLNVRLEYVPDPKGTPVHLPFVPSPRDITWQNLYEEYRGKIDEQFAFLAFRTAPLVSSTSMDAKIATAEMAKHMMMWAVFGKPNQREWVPSKWERDNYPHITGIYSSGYRLFQTEPSESLQRIVAANEKSRLARVKETPEKKKDAESPFKDRLWKGWILPASDSDTWLTAGSAAYYEVLNSKDWEKELQSHRAGYAAAVIKGDESVSLRSSNWFDLATHKGVLRLDALRRSMGDDKFFAMMTSFFAANTTKTVSTAQFQTAAGTDASFAVPQDNTVEPYVPSHLHQRLATALLVYNTLEDAGANRHAAELLQSTFLNYYESEVPIRKDFELTDDDLRTHDIVFVGRPDSKPFDGASFTINGKPHASENEAVMLASPNPLNLAKMFLIIAGNSALETVRLASSAQLNHHQFTLFTAGKETDSGFLK